MIEKRDLHTGDRALVIDAQFAPSGVYSGDIVEIVGFAGVGGYWAIIVNKENRQISIGEGCISKAAYARLENYKIETSK